MLEALRHFAFEALIGGVGLALIAAGMAVWGAPQGWLIGNIPIIGRLIESAKHAIGAVLFAAGFAAVAFVAGYAHRGTLDQSAALRDQILTEQALRDFAETRTEQFAAAQRAATARANDLAAQMRAIGMMKEKHDVASTAHDADACLAADSVQRLNAIGRRKSRR